MFSSRSFTVFGLTFRSLIHFEFIFYMVLKSVLISFFNTFILFIYFWLHWVFVAVRGLSLVVASGSYSSLWCVGLSLWWLLMLWSTGSRHLGFSSHGMRAQ